MSTRQSRKLRLPVALIAGSSAVALMLTGCSAGGGGGSTGSGAGTITVWAQEGQAGEVQAAKDVVDAFNKSQADIKVELTFIPQATYGQTLSTTDVKSLPDVYEYDGETMAALVYAGKLRDLGDVVKKETISGQLPSVISEVTYSDNKAYGVAQYDSGLGLFGNRSMLAAAGITDIPTKAEDAWSADKFDAAIKALAAKSPNGKGIDLKEQYGGTWPGYAFTPVVASAGQPLVQDGKADGHMNAPEVIKAIERFAGWRQYNDPNADDAAFTDKRVGLSWVGHWMYPAYSKALGDDLVTIPLPDFGNGSKSGQGSHAWGISASSDNAAAGGKFLDFLMQDEWVLNITKANGAVPGTTSAIDKNELYADGGPLALYKEQLNATCGSEAPTKDCVTVPRTISPAWPVINKSFSDAFFAIYQGGNAKEELDKAAKAIDLDYKDNAEYK